MHYLSINCKTRTIWRALNLKFQSKREHGYYTVKIQLPDFTCWVGQERPREGAMEGEAGSLLPDPPWCTTLCSSPLSVPVFSAPFTCAFRPPPLPVNVLLPPVGPSSNLTHRGQPNALDPPHSFLNCVVCGVPLWRNKFHIPRGSPWLLCKAVEMLLWRTLCCDTLIHKPHGSSGLREGAGVQ